MAPRYGDFTGSIPEIYDRCLGPVMLDGYGVDMASRISVADDARVLEIAAGTGISTRRLRDVTAASVAEIAFGFVKGSPIIIEIRDNPEIDEDAVVDAVTTAVTELGGDNPLRARIQAILVTAR
ncbi:MAG TPA: hypothetical protein EYQ81_06445 [Sneathiellales bacterium]|jgi:hypothetical protein|nr:hypothetical protein [Sneathiellales bacterium]